MSDETEKLRQQLKEAMEGDGRATEVATSIIVGGVKDNNHGVVIVLVANEDGIGLASSLCECHLSGEKSKKEVLQMALTAGVLKLRLSESSITHVRVDDRTIPVEKPKGGA